LIGRLGASVGAAAIPSAAVITGAADGWCPLVLSGLGLLIPVALLVPMAPYVKGLHKLPLFGAPQLEATFEVDGRASMKVGVRRKPNFPAPPPNHRPDWFDPDAPPAFEPRTVHVQVGIHNPARNNIERATVTFMHPEGLPHEETRSRGELSTRGEWMPPTSESLTDDRGWSDYWVGRGPLDARDHSLLYFKLTLPEPGTYKLRLKVTAADLHEPFIRNAEIRGVEIERGKEPALDKMAYLIQETEDLVARLEDPSVANATDPATELANQLAAAYEILPDGRPDLEALLSQSKKVTPGHQVGDPYFIKRLRVYLAAFYDVRARLAKSLFSRAHLGKRAGSAARKQRRKPKVGSVSRLSRHGMSGIARRRAENPARRPAPGTRVPRACAEGDGGPARRPLSILASHLARIATPSQRGKTCLLRTVP
jgi:hypothetical protein